MAGQTYSLEELDDATRGYLRAVHASKGNGMAGIYVPVTDWGAGCGLILGIIIIGTTIFCISPPLNDPTNVTLWLTAGVLLGGWLIVAAIRIWLARARGTNLGSFQYADPWNLWNVTGTKIEHIDLSQVVGVNLVENRDSEGAYQSSVIKIITAEKEEEWKSNMEIGAREIHAYVEYWLQTRAGGGLSKGMVEEHAALARGYAYDQAVLPGERLPVDIPRPERVGNARFGWLNLLTVVAAGVGLFFLLHPLVLAWRDNALFELLRNREPNELRAYLVDPRNTRHREEVKRLLAAKYEPRIAAFQNRIRMSPDTKVKEFADPLGVLLQETSQAIMPAISVRVRETKSELVNPGFEVASAKERETLARKKLAEELQGNMSEFYLSVAEAPKDGEKDVPAHIDVEYKIVREMDTEAFRIHGTVKVRKTPDEEPMYSGAWTSNAFSEFDARNRIDALVQAFTGSGPYPQYQDALKAGDWGGVPQ